MNRQDLSGARTAQDLERKYNFEEIKRNVEKVKKNSEDINSINKDLQDFAKNITKDLGELQDQVDGNITTWFYKGVPTLSNYPANEWTTTEDRNNHLGDLYYDQDTGYSYRFTMLKSVFQWVKLTDSDITEALAVANAAQDTADKKRRVFLEQPKPPYDSGDMWIKDKEIWICQVSRAEGTYQTGDFINNLKYTDDTYAKGVNDDLIIVKGTVTQTRQDVDSLQTTMTSTVEALNTQGEKIGTLETKQSNITQTVEGIDARVTRNTNSINNINTPTKDLSGSTIHLEDGAEAPFVDFSVDGKSYQENREGYNLLPQPYINESQTIKGIRFTINKDYSITVNGTATGTVYFNLYDKGNLFFNATLYANNGNNGYWLKGVTKSVFVVYDNNNGLVFLQINNGITVNNETVYPMITTEINKDKPYQPYGVMPSPDFPSEIESVGYENLFNKEMKTIPNKGIIFDGSLFNSSVSSVSDFIKVIPNTKYVYSGFNDNDYTKRVVFYNKKKENTYNKYEIAYETKNECLNFTTSKNTYYIKMQLKTAEIPNIQLVKGTSSHPYIPYGKYGLDITNVGKNLFDKNNVIDGKRIALNGATHNDENYVITNYIKIKPNTMYSSNYGITAYTRIAIYNKNKDLLFTNQSSRNFNTGNNAYYMRFGVAKNNINNAQIEERTQATPYEPYKGYNTQIILLEQLKSVNEKDKLVRKNGVWGIEKIIRTLKLKIANMNNGEDYPGWNNVPYINKDFPNHNGRFHIVTNFYTNFTEYSCDGIRANTIGDNKVLFLHKEWFNKTQSQWKQQYPDLEVVIQYRMPKPEFIPLEDSEQDKLNKLATFKGTNNITTTDELEPNLNLEYVRDTNISNYVSEQLGELSISNNQIKASVKEIGTNLDTNTQQLNQVQNTITSQNQTIEIISKNIDRTNGNIKEVTTTNGFTFNNKGLNIYTDENSYNTQIDNVGTYYRDGNAVIAQTTKDGSLMKDLSEQGQHRYSYDTTDSTYNLIDETIEIDGEIGYATFWNGED